MQGKCGLEIVTKLPVVGQVANKKTDLCGSCSRPADETFVLIDYKVYKRTGYRCALGFVPACRKIVAPRQGSTCDHSMLHRQSCLAVECRAYLCYSFRNVFLTALCSKCVPGCKRSVDADKEAIQTQRMHYR